MESVTNFFGAQGVNSGSSSLMIMGLFFLAFWFLLIAPQRKKQKEQEKMISSLKSGDSVLMTSGIVATIVQVKGEVLIVKSADSKLEMHRNFVQNRWKPAKEKA